MCPDQGSNPQPFGVWDDAPTNWATRPGLLIYLFTGKICQPWFRWFMGTSNLLCPKPNSLLPAMSPADCTPGLPLSGTGTVTHGYSGRSWCSGTDHRPTCLTLNLSQSLVGSPFKMPLKPDHLPHPRPQKHSRSEFLPALLTRGARWFFGAEAVPGTVRHSAASLSSTTRCQQHHQPGMDPPKTSPDITKCSLGCKIPPGWEALV